MGRFQNLRFFVKVLNYSSAGASRRQSFLGASSQCRLSRMSCHTSSKEVSIPSSLGVKRSAIDAAEDLDLSDYGSVVMPSFNFAAYADKSPLLQELLKLGVNLYEVEKKPGVDYLLTLKWENVEKYLSFLTANGVPSEKLGEFITLNPFIFKEDLEDLQIRINYLESKKFDKESISNILVKNPKWLSVPVRTIDERLGFLQQSFNFKGDHIRKIVSTCPSLGTISKKKIMVNIFILKEELRLDEHAARKVILSAPVLLRKNPFEFVSMFDYMTETMKVSQDLVLKQPKVLTYRKHLVVERHLFLQSLGRAQYNSLLPGYVSLTDLIETTDEVFCEKIARASLECYDQFLKTL